MDALQTSEKIDVKVRIKEAEIYRSMGLLKESLGIYEELLSVIPEHEPDNLEIINKQVPILKEELKDLDESVPEISQKDISLIKEVVSTDGSDPVEILNSATAFKELGLLEEAMVEYEKLFEMDYPAAKIIPDFGECLLEVFSSDEAVERMEQTINKQNLKNQQMAQIRFSFGLQLEHRGHKDLSVIQFKIASRNDPENEEIKEKLDLRTPTVSRGSRYSYLLKTDATTVAQLQKALDISKKIKKSVEFVLISHFKIKKKEIGKSLSEFYGCPFQAFDANLSIPFEIVSKLKKSYLLHAGWVPLRWGKERLEVLIDDPRDLRKSDQIIALMKTKQIDFSVGIKEDIEEFINHFIRSDAGASVDDMFEEMDMISHVPLEELDDDDEEQDAFDESSSQVVKLIDQVILTAFRKDASDIHIEPSIMSKMTNIRFRVDGLCQEYAQVPNSMARGLISRVKIMANMDITERRLPQDGKIKFRRKGFPHFELRVATLPTTGGFEAAALRILAEAGAMKLEEAEMGLNERNMKVIKKIIAQPYGIILAAGPTGSGKTTTLHAALGSINHPEIKIWTAEDPVEITQSGISQVEVKPKIGLDFSRLLRSFLRADPDVIMIGEMRDYETASTAVKAALTGHLVFSTLHTNSASETVARLLGMGLDALNFSDALLGVLAQRLVRKLCLECREKYHPSRDEFEEIVNDYGADCFEATNIVYAEDLVLYRSVGCETCSDTGYKGRTGIHELMEGTPQIKLLIKNNASSEELFAQAAKEGMTTLRQDGIQKIFQGLTDMSEVRRVCIN